jgi:hypothetical protein
VKNEELTEKYQENFGEFGIIGYYRYLSDYEDETKVKYYYLLYGSSRRRMLLGSTLKSVSIRLEDMYLHKRCWDFLKPYPTLIELEREQKKADYAKLRNQKRQDLIRQVSMVKEWGRGVIAKIAANLGRKVSAVRQMLSVLTKEGLLVRIKRGQYSVA